MKFKLIKTERGLRGVTAEDHAAWLKFKRRLETMKTGSMMRAEFATMRNGRHHRKLMALLHLISENSEIYDTVEKALVAVKLVVGHFEPVVHPETGELIQIPKSISYESMGQEDFDVFFGRAVSAVCDHIVPQFDEETARWMLEKIIEGWVS